MVRRRHEKTQQCTLLDFFLSHAYNYKREKIRFDRLLSTTHFHDMLFYDSEGWRFQNV